MFNFLCCYGVSASYAMPESQSELNPIQLNYAQLVTKSENKYVTSYHLSEKNFDRLDKSLSDIGKTRDQRNTEVLKALSLTDEEIENIDQSEISLILNDSCEITVTESYVKTDENGTHIISKDQCMKEVALENGEIHNTDQPYGQGEFRTMASSNDGNNEEISDDGYMKITTIASYIRPGSTGAKGWYWVSGTFTWLKLPNYRMTDAFSLYAGECMWSQSTSDYYATMTYETSEYWLPDRFGEHKYTEKKVAQDKEISEHGLFYKFKLPGDNSKQATLNSPYQYITVKSLSFYIRAKVRISDFDKSKAINVFTRYEHTFSALSIQPSFSWAVGESYPGVSANVGVVNDSDSFYSLCEIEYQPNRNVYK